MSEKKSLNQEQLEKANGGAPYSPPEYDDIPLKFQVKNDRNQPFEGSKRDLDRVIQNIPGDTDGKGDPGKK